MEKQDLSATSWLTARLTVVGIVGLGLLMLAPDLVAGWVGGPERVLGWGLFVAFLLIASLSWEKNQLRVRNAEMMEALNQLLYGRDYAQHREAIEILLTALESKDAVSRKAAHENLVRLTGQNFADDPQVWRAWWGAHGKTWAARKRDG
jgi:hypothetical protein